MFPKTTHKHVVDDKSIQRRKHESVSIHGVLVMKSMNHKVNCVHPGKSTTQTAGVPSVRIRSWLSLTSFMKLTF